MNLGIRLHDVQKGPIEERVRIASEQGFTCAHLALKKVYDDVNVDDEALTPGFAAYLRKLFEKNNLDIAVLGNYLNLATPDEEAYKKNLHRYMAHMRMAALMDVGVVGSETGAVNTAYKYEAANHSDDALKLFIDRVRPVVKYAQDAGVIFAIEPVWKHIVCNPARARKVLDEIDSPNLQIIFDPVNLLDISNFEKREEIFEEAMDVLGPDIAMIHIKDFVVEGNELKSVAAGTGLMDYTSILTYIKKHKPYIHVSLENTVPSSAVWSREYIQNMYDAL